MLQSISAFKPERIFSVLGLPVHLTSDYTNWLYQRLVAKEGTHVVTLNAEMAILTQSDEILANIIKSADLVVPDGAGVILYMRLRGLDHRRCPGIELSEALLKRVGNSASSTSIYFFGGSPGVSEKAASSWRQHLPGLQISTQHGYLQEEEQQLWLEKLKQEQPQLIFVGLGVPRQELWIQKHRNICPNSIWIGVGGSFDIWAGTKVRAPKWLRNNNLEWSYRLYQEPHRWRRMLALPKFLFLSLLRN